MESAIVSTCVDELEAAGVTVFPPADGDERYSMIFPSGLSGVRQPFMSFPAERFRQIVTETFTRQVGALAADEHPLTTEMGALTVPTLNPFPVRMEGEYNG